MRFVLDRVQQARLGVLVVRIIELRANDHLFSVINVALITASHIFEDRLDLAVLLLFEPHIMRVQVAIFIVVFVVESDLSQMVFLFVPL